MRVLVCVAVLLSLLGVTGCGVFAPAPVMAPIAVEKGPYITAVDNAVGSTKVGRSKAEGILIVGFGDASIATAAANGKITKIHHIDTEVLNVIGVYSRYETVVYGE